MYIPLLEERFVDYIGRIKPRYCIHFEPCYEYQDGSTVHGLLCKKYIEVNDYNRNLVQVLQQAQQAGKIRIIEVQKNIFGNNPLLPISAVVWQFTAQSFFLWDGQQSMAAHVDELQEEVFIVRPRVLA